jgi:thioesterase domain-containing protein
MQLANFPSESGVPGIMSGMVSSSPVIFLSGAGGGAPDFDVFRDGACDTTCFEVIGYPGWRRYIAGGLSAEVLIADLAAQVVAKVPQGPIRIVGLSIGGHLGYATGLHLQAMGREIAGLCAIDSFMFASSGPVTGWKGRALEQGFELLRKRRIGEFARFLRSKFWRATLRLAGGRLPDLLERFSSSSWLPSISNIDPSFEAELSMRLLIRETAPWLASLDREPVALAAPATLLRTALTAGDDAAWRRRCPRLEIFEIEGQHHTLFEPENVGSLREAFITGTRGWR